MKGIILAGGTGSRLKPLTNVTNKHLLPVYKKPMIYYPLEAMLKANIREILFVTGGEHIGDFFRLLGSGKSFGAHFMYEIQDGSGGTAAALLLAEGFVKDEDFLVILGDNIVTEEINSFVEDFKNERKKYLAKILISKVQNPKKYGVVTFKDNLITEIIEKPQRPKSKFVNTGLWMFSPEVFQRIKKLKKSPRGEFEITDVLSQYALERKLTYSILRSTWTDAGSFESLYDATVLMKKLEERLLKKGNG